MPTPPWIRFWQERHNSGCYQPCETNWFKCKDGKNKSPHAEDTNQDMPIWRSFSTRSNYTRGSNIGSDAPKHCGGPFRGKCKQNKLKLQLVESPTETVEC